MPPSSKIGRLEDSAVMDAAIVEDSELSTIGAVLVPLMAIAADWRSGSRRMPPSSKIRNCPPSKTVIGGQRGNGGQQSRMMPDGLLITLTALVDDSDWRSASRRMPPSSKIRNCPETAVSVQTDAAIVEDWPSRRFGAVLVPLMAIAADWRSDSRS